MNETSGKSPKLRVVIASAVLDMIERDAPLPPLAAEVALFLLPSFSLPAAAAGCGAGSVQL